MGTFLFDSTIFGPVRSRRLGISLGINLLPNSIKYCNFDCIYCECGWNIKSNTEKIKLPSHEDVAKLLTAKLKKMKEEDSDLDVITFAGNGEPTIHPNFDGIIDDTIKVRDQYFPMARIAVLSNATRVSKKEVFEALQKIDDNILKLDSVFDETIIQLNNPNNFKGVSEIIENLKRFNGNFILQTMFVKGKYNNQIVDNTTEKELKAWLAILPVLNPKQIMIYTIARDTPASELEKISINDLEKIAEKIKALGFQVQVSG